jgi:hypothetical protein
MCPLQAPVFQGFFLFLFWLGPLTVLMKQTRQAVHAPLSSLYYLDVYDKDQLLVVLHHLVP